MMRHSIHDLHKFHLSLDLHLQDVSGFILLHHINNISPVVQPQNEHTHCYAATSSSSLWRLHKMTHSACFPPEVRVKGLRVLKPRQED